jgi:hypothetical protein
LVPFIDDLRETFDNLDKFYLKLNLIKCFFGVPAGELLGYLVSARGIGTNPEKIHAFLMTSRPPQEYPRLSLYQMAMVEVGVMSAAIVGREIAPQPESAPRRKMQ